jgi:hypothetical protein
MTVAKAPAGIVPWDPLVCTGQPLLPAIRTFAMPGLLEYNWFTAIHCSEPVRDWRFRMQNRQIHDLA